MPAPDTINFDARTAKALDQSSSLMFWERDKHKLMVKSEFAFGDENYHLYRSCELTPDRFAHVFKETNKEKALEMFKHL